MGVDGLRSGVFGLFLFLGCFFGVMFVLFVGWIVCFAGSGVFAVFYVFIFFYCCFVGFFNFLLCKCFLLCVFVWYFANCFLEKISRHVSVFFC